MDDSEFFHQVLDNVNFIDERINNLENNSIKIKVLVERLNKRIKNYKEVNQERIKNAFINLDEIDNALKELKEDVRKIIPLIKNLVHENEFNQLKEKIENWQLESFITDNDVNRINK